VYIRITFVMHALNKFVNDIVQARSLFHQRMVQCLLRLRLDKHSVNRLTGCTEFVQPFRSKSLFGTIFESVVNGRQPSRVVADVMRLTRAEYHLARCTIYRVKKQIDDIVNDRFAM
jgi:hypothetical protein